MKKLIFATGNEHKMKEIRMILADLGMEILSQKEAGIQADVVEDGTTFEENAQIKAGEISKIALAMPEYKDAIVLADDSGLEIDYLGGEPGIYSARYLGEDTSYDIKNQVILDRLAGVPDEERTARFVCAIAAALPDGRKEVVRGTMEGIIGHEIAGENGFGYDDQVNENGEIIDDYRIDYMRKHIQEMKLAIEEGVDCRGYLSWGPVDILSSRAQMKKRYGFIYVNRDNDDLKDMRRIKKKSFHWFKHVIETNGEEL